MPKVPSKKKERAHSPPRLKRFAEGCTPGARRSRKRYEDDHDAHVEIAPSSQSRCRVCKDKIPRGDPRIALLLQCHAGYKDPSLTHRVHVGCLAAYPGAVAALSFDEIFYRDLLTKEQSELLSAQFPEPK
jgi:hypothetical protein